MCGYFDNPQQLQDSFKGKAAGQNRTSTLRFHWKIPPLHAITLTGSSQPDHSTGNRQMCETNSGT